MFGQRAYDDPLTRDLQTVHEQLRDTVAGIGRTRDRDRRRHCAGGPSTAHSAENRSVSLILLTDGELPRAC